MHFKILTVINNKLYSNFLNRSCPAFTKYISRSTISVFKDLRPVYKVYVKPNAKNQISTPVEVETRDIVEDDSETIQCENCFSCFGKCSQMEKKIVKHALAVLDKTKMEKIEQSKIEATLEIITNKLNILLNR